MTMLSERDVKLALELVYDSAGMEDGEPFPRELLLRLTRLIPADAIVGEAAKQLGLLLTQAKRRIEVTAVEAPKASP